jgi:hypothetical protein
VDDPQIGERRRCIDRSIGTAEEGDVGMFGFSGARGFDPLGDVF